MTVLFAAAVRISSISETCRRLRDAPCEETYANALYANLFCLEESIRKVNAAFVDHLPRPLRLPGKRPLRLGRRPDPLALLRPALPGEPRDLPLPGQARLIAWVSDFVFGFEIARKNQEQSLKLSLRDTVPPLSLRVSFSGAFH